jgi:hypothetical protein
MDDKQFEIRNEEVQEILEKTPTWPLRWGNLLIFSITLTGFILLSRIDLSTKIAASVKIYEKNLADTLVQGKYGIMHIGQENINAVKPGMIAQLNIVGYPAREYGYVNSKIETIKNEVDDKNQIAVVLVLPNGLNTTTGKQIPMRNGLLCIATIKTGNKNFFRNIFSSF